MRLIEHWRTYLKRAWSLRLGALALFFTLLDWLNRAGLLNIWVMMPPEVRAALPPWITQAIGAVLFGAALAARVIKQPKLEEKIAEKVEEKAEAKVQEPRDEAG